MGRGGGVIVEVQRCRSGRCVVRFGLLGGVVEVEAAEAGFEMAVLQKKICVFSR
jgi:hypothetical protein